LTEHKRQGAERERLLQEAQTRSAELKEARDELESKIERRPIALRHLSSKLIHVQDEERRRIARELHDSIGQYLAALGMGLAQLENGNASKFSETLIECRQLLDRCISETRTLSYLLHPPLLDEVGFVSAATNYVEEFSRRSKINTEISLDLPYRLPADT
jgi:two-component system NarL family sensor kinase